MNQPLAGPTQHPTYDPADSVVRVRDLCRSFTPTGGVLRGVDLDLRAGEIVALLGRRGSGKSTLLRALAREDHEVVGSGTLRLPESIATLGADPRLLGWKRVLDNVTTGIRSADALRRGRRAFAEVGLAECELSWPGDLSPADQQRVALARALVGVPELILADEPFRDVDALAQRDLHRLLRTLVATHRPAVLFVTNDVHEAVALADRAVSLRDGRIHGDVVVRGGDGTSPRGEEYAALRSYLLAELGLGAATPVPSATAPAPRRETA